MKKADMMLVAGAALIGAGLCQADTEEGFVQLFNGKAPPSLHNPKGCWVCCAHFS